MQVIDWINREEWTDRPLCVHPVIRALAININDSANDQERQKLLDLAPRMMNTASRDKQLSVKLAIFCAERVLHLFEEKCPNDDRPRKAIEAAKSGNAAAYADAAAKAAYAADAADAAAKAAYADDAADAADAAAKAAASAAYAAYADAYAAYAAADAAAKAGAYADDAADAADAAAKAAAAADDAAKLNLLTAVLDEYDRLTGRSATEEIDWTPAVCVMAKA